MLGRIFTVGGYTLLSRLTGFARDIMLAAILGAGPVADAFFVALRLPNHFRAIFAEGAFNAAFVPAYAHVHGARGEASAKLFADRIFTLLFVSQLVLLVIAWFFMPQAMSILAPGFTDDAEQRRLAIDLTRITFPYLLLITLVTLYGGMLNVMQRFASAAAASIFLNIAMMATLALAAFFPTAIYYPKSMHQQTAYRDYPIADGGVPVCEALSDDVISLPMHAYIDEPTQERIIAAVRSALSA